MKSIILTSLFTAFFFNIYGQKWLVDSLHEILPNTQHPIQKVDVLLGLTRASLFVGGPSAGYPYADQALQLAHKNKDQAGVAMALIFKIQTYSSNPPEIAKALKIARNIHSNPLEAFASYHLAEYYLYDKNNYKEALKILSSALQRADKTVPDKHLGNIHKVTALAYMTAGDEANTFDHFQKALYHFERVKTHPFVDPKLGRPSAMDADGGELNKIQVLLFLSRVYFNRANLPKALELAQTALGLAQKNEVETQLVWAYEELAVNYMALGKYDQAIEQYQKAIQIHKKNNSLRFLAVDVQELGSIFYRMKDWEVAETYYRKALKINTLILDTLGMIQNYSRLGQVALSQNRAQSALQFYNQAARLNGILKDSTRLSFVLTDIGRVWQQQNKQQKALGYFQSALALNQRFSLHNATLNNYIEIARVYATLTQVDSAKHYGLLALDFAGQYGSLEQQKLVQQLLSQISAQAGEYQQALVYHQNYFKLHDSIFTNQAQEKLKQEQVGQNVADYQQAKEQAERETALLSTRNRLYLALALALLGIILIGGYLFLQLRKTQKELRAQNQKLQQLNATKDKFFGIIAHDIRSPIIALDGVGEQMAFYLEKQRPEKLVLLAERVDKTAKQLTALLDNLLNWALLQQGVIPYRPTPLNIHHVSSEVLTMFQTNAQAKNIQLESQVPETLEVYADESTLHAILRNLLSNAIKFTPPGGTVSISTEVNEDKVFIKVNDTGTGISAEKLEKLFLIDKSSEKGTAGERGTGLGLMLVKEFVELNKGKVQVESKINEGSQFIVSLPKAA
ncbi:tetratricopeptide repeat protein [Haliscomenobacter hydrossis]|uniref:histidine kinase n=1 Tax=Haliscomenobacter hydrossis (strain ATCC 27775 / DSM 1100 / LMG 10767 / O) TaxID=760192 RepID=F4KWN4_HALH1|nr:tetratricopeptide repeat protein [Haliscomenobacter hydrossis]AEE51374.1 ATP-binding region ATPase domain protein [Haliscomenobacter hydrossis DSM 1100]